jgi:hypothetical protein
MTVRGAQESNLHSSEAGRLQRLGLTHAQAPRMVPDRRIELRASRESDECSAIELVGETVRTAGIEPATFHVSGGCSTTELGTEMLNDRYRVVKEFKNGSSPREVPGGCCEGR